MSRAAIARSRAACVARRLVSRARRSRCAIRCGRSARSPPAARAPSRKRPALRGDGRADLADAACRGRQRQAVHAGRRRRRRRDRGDRARHRALARARGRTRDFTRSPRKRAAADCARRDGPMTSHTETTDAGAAPAGIGHGRQRRSRGGLRQRARRRHARRDRTVDAGGRAAGAASDGAVRGAAEARCTRGRRGTLRRRRHRAPTRASSSWASSRARAAT